MGRRRRAAGIASRQDGRRGSAARRIDAHRLAIGDCCLAPPQDAPEPPSDVLDLLAAMRGLPVSQREVLVLHYLVELSLDEVARHLRIPGGTAKSRLARGRRALVRALGAEIDREDVHHA